MVFIEHRARPATKKKFCFFLLQTLKTALSFSKTLEKKISPPPHKSASCATQFLIVC